MSKKFQHNIMQRENLTREEIWTTQLMRDEGGQ